ncbi:MAG TPA: DMT family transporter [Pseudomonadales bacterium]|nr:DMT family transporter [Pseudomonadales bacterium]
MESTPGRPLSERLAALPGNVRGALWLLLSSVLFSVMALAAKLAGSDWEIDGELLAPALPSIEVTFFRSAATLLTTLPFVLRSGRRAVVSQRPLLAILRGCLGAGGMLCNFHALIHLPLATAISIQFARPLFVLVLAALVLHEWVSARRTSVALVGFVGVLVIVRPGPTMDPAALIAVGGGALLAGSIILLRILSRDDDTVSLLFYSGVAGTLFTLVPALLAWRWPTLAQWGLIAVIAVFGVAGQSCFMKGYAAGEASAMAPFDYSRLIFATLWGYLVFGNLPDAWTWAGSAILIGATWYALRLQREEAATASRRAAAGLATPSRDPLQ